MLKVVKKVTKEVSVYCCDLCGKESVRRSWLTGKIIWDKYSEIYKSAELSEKPTHRKIRVVQIEGRGQ